MRCGPFTSNENAIVDLATHCTVSDIADDFMACPYDDMRDTWSFERKENPERYVELSRSGITVNLVDGEREADFLPVIVWRGQADNCYKYLKKGSKAAVCGSIQTRSYDGSDGTRRYITEIVADEVEFLSSRQADGEGDEPAKEKPAKKDVVNKFEPIDDDNLPF